MNAKWVNLQTGVPTALNFGTTGGLGSPINVDLSTMIPYVLVGSTVTALAGSGGGGETLDLDGGDANGVTGSVFDFNGGDANG